MSKTALPNLLKFLGAHRIRVFADGASKAIPHLNPLSAPPRRDPKGEAIKSWQWRANLQQDVLGLRLSPFGGED